MSSQYDCFDRNGRGRDSHCPTRNWPPEDFGTTEMKDYRYLLIVLRNMDQKPDIAYLEHNPRKAFDSAIAVKAGIGNVGVLVIHIVTNECLDEAWLSAFGCDRRIVHRIDHCKLRIQ